MKQEGKEFFVNIEDKEETTPFLKALVTHSSFETFGLPWNVFKIKMIPEIANEYWPHNFLPPMHDLQKIKTYFKEAIKNLSEEELKYNKIDIPYYEYKKDF